MLTFLKEIRIPNIVPKYLNDLPVTLLDEFSRLLDSSLVEGKKTAWKETPAWATQTSP